ncbi:MAG: hypothetical protein KKC19_03670 [Nanoarchaeota archaeon]|nr:hypothetical protein [Nanoarchaeota archaeon]
MATDKSRVLVTVLVVVVIVLLAIIAYALVVSPRLSGYVVNKQVEGYQIAVLDIAQAAAQCQTVPIQVSENQTINLLAAECLPQEILQQLQGNAAQ